MDRMDKTEILTNEEYKLITNDKKTKEIKRFDILEITNMLSKGATLEELADYCKTTVVNYFNYCTECNGLIQEEDAIAKTGFFKCPSCSAINKL